VIGWSMGAVIASHLARTAGDRVDRLVLIAPGLFLDKPRRLALVERLPFATRILGAQASRFIDRLIGEHLTRPEGFTAYRDEMHEQLRFPGFARSFASTLKNYPWQAGPELRELADLPRRVMLLWGDDDPSTPYTNARRVLDIYPRAELVTFAGARHAPHVEFGDRAARAIREFLA